MIYGNLFITLFDTFNEGSSYKLETVKKYLYDGRED